MFYLRIVLINLSLSSAFAGCILFFFNYPMSLLLTHTALCFLAYLSGVLFSVLLGIARQGSFRTFLQPLAFSVVSTLLIFLYVGDFVSNYFWKANLNINLINRILNHYYHLYQLETVLIIGIIPLVVLFLVNFSYIKIYKSYYSVVERPAIVTFFTLSMVALIGIQTYTVFYKSNTSDLNNYFYGELVLDLFRDYTDSHSDYLADGDVVVDRVVQSVNYVEQKASNIQLSKKNIIVVVVDCLRSDHLSGYGYHRDTTPFITNLVDSHNGAVVDNFFAMCDESKCGIRSILTSRGIGEQSSAQASENSLNRVLTDDGYQINFLLTSDHAFGGLKKIYYPNDFYMDGLGFKDYPLNDDRGIVSALEEWPRYNGTPNYFHFHLLSAHEASISYGKYLEQGVMGIKPGFLVDNPIKPRYFTPDATAKQEANDWQDNKIFQADLIISRILGLLGEKGYMDNALVVITADHGQGLNEHGYRGHISGLYNESLGVPLILVDTSDTSLNIAETSFGTQLDIAPTILKAIGVSVPKSWEGQVLQQKKLSPQVTQHVIPNRSSSFAKILYDPKDQSLYKYIFMSTLGGMKEERFLYDLVNDPGEQRNLLDSNKHRGTFLKLIDTWKLDAFDG